MQNVLINYQIVSVVLRTNTINKQFFSDQIFEAKHILHFMCTFYMRGSARTSKAIWK